jgi:hypothetical protein
MIPEHEGEKMDVEHARLDNLKCPQCEGAYTQLREAWGAVAFYSQMDYNDAILEYRKLRNRRQANE